MKKTSINLLTNKQDYYGLERKFAAVRTAALVLCILLVAAGSAFAYFYLKERSALSDRIRQKERLLSEIATYKEDEAKLSLFAKKLQYFDDFNKEDARFSPYYNLLAGTLQSASSSARLTEFKISKDRKVEFVLSFDTLDEALGVFSGVESDEFTSHFQTLSLSNFSGSAAENSKYELEFDGVFKPIQTDL